MHGGRRTTRRSCTGYAGTAIIRGSKIGGMFNDNVRGMPTFETMYVTQ